MNRAQLHSFRRRLDCLLADPRPDREALHLLFAELMIAYLALLEERAAAHAARRARRLGLRHRLRDEERLLWTRVLPEGGI